MKVSDLALLGTLAAALIATTELQAQTLYRCGNEFSQKPCAASAVPLKTRSDAVPDRPPTPYGVELCSSEAPRLLNFLDPPSTRIASVTPGGTEVIQYADKPTAAKKFVMRMSTKNAYGAYEGEATYQCFLSEDQQRVLKVSAARK